MCRLTWARSSKGSAGAAYMGRLTTASTVPMGRAAVGKQRSICDRRVFGVCVFEGADDGVTPVNGPENQDGTRPARAFGQRGGGALRLAQRCHHVQLAPIDAAVVVLVRCDDANDRRRRAPPWASAAMFSGMSLSAVHSSVRSRKLSAFVSCLHNVTAVCSHCVSVPCPRVAARGLYFVFAASIIDLKASQNWAGVIADTIGVTLLQRLVGCMGWSAAMATGGGGR